MTEDETPIQTPRDVDPTDLGRLDARVQPGDDPTIIGPYRLVRPLGEGGMRQVWQAEQKVPIERTVALKLIKLGMDVWASEGRDGPLLAIRPPRW